MPPNPWILFATSEIYPFSKTGGLGDVMGALPLTLHNMGIKTAVITPLYGRIKKAGIPFHLINPDLHVGYPWDPITADIYYADFHGMPVYFISRDEYFQRSHFYNTYKGDYFDNCERFIFYARAVLEWTRLQETPPAVINCNDWQTALIPGYLNHWRMGDPFWSGTRTVMSIHNLAFQGRFASRLFMNSGLPDWTWNMDGAEFWGDFNLLKTGIAYSDHITTVSPSYATEIVTPAFGCGLEGILSRRSDSLTGILNGADYQVWDPSNDPMIPAPYNVHDISGKAVCKQALIDEQGLNPFLANRPILGFIGRLQEQKGIDLLLEIFERIIQRNVGIVVLGEGNLRFEERVLRLMEEYPLRLSANVSYTEDLAHRIQAGSDIFLMPSRYEPCGLTQMYSLRYGTPPVATAVGGLRDTIIPYPHPECTGFIFDESSADQFYNAICQAIDVWETNKHAWQQIQLRAMRQDFSWQLSANKYLSLYRQLGCAL